MASLILDKCCFCIDLRVGCFIIAYLKLVVSIVAMMLVIIAMSASGVLVAESITDGAKINEDLGSAWLGVGGMIMMVLVGILLLFVVVALAFVITFLVGLHHNRRGHVKAYLIYGIIFLIAHLIIFVIISAYNPLSIPFLITNLITLLLHMYFLTVIRSYYVSMKYTKGLA